MCVCLLFPVLAFFQSTERGSRDEWNTLIFKVSQLTFFELRCVSVAFSTSPICLSPALALSLSPFFYLSLALCRCLVILTSASGSQHLWRCRRVSLCCLIFSPLKFLLLLLMFSVTEDAFFFFFFCGFLKNQPETFTSISEIIIQ